MEVACGEYGDNVPKLVVALKSGQAKQFQHLTNRKVVNLKQEQKSKDVETDSLVSPKLHDSVVAGAPGLAGDCVVDFDGGVSWLMNPNLDIKETAILDDNFSDFDSGSVLSDQLGACAAVYNQNHATSTVQAKPNFASVTGVHSDAPQLELFVDSSSEKTKEKEVCNKAYNVYIIFKCLLLKCMQ